MATLVQNQNTQPPGRFQIKPKVLLFTDQSESLRAFTKRRQWLDKVTKESFFYWSSSCSELMDSFVFQRAPSAAAQQWPPSAASARLLPQSRPKHLAGTWKGCTACRKLFADSASIPFWPCGNQTHIRIHDTPTAHTGSLEYPQSLYQSLEVWL